MPGPGVLHVEITAPRIRVDAGPIPQLRLLATLAGVPVAYHEIANPGGAIEPWLLELLLGEEVDLAARRADAAAALAARMGVPQPEHRPLRVSVVVCTRRRPGALRMLLEALGRLDSPPHEVVVVDNDPGPEPVRTLVEQHGHVYLREDARGLDRARSVGLRRATGEVVAYVDDDCVPPPSWLSALGGHFADPSVGAVTGPAFAWSVATPAQARFEREDGFRRGLEARRFDWSLLPPSRATAAGAGANMAFRRSALTRCADPFPAELDAGTPTESGGDMWALAAVLANGWRVQYDPAHWVFHQHRPDAEAMHHALWGYGVGLNSALIKLLREERELAAVGAMTWVMGRWARGTLLRAAGRVDAVQQRLGWDYLRGGLAAPRRYAAARRETRRATLGAAPPTALAAPRAAAADAATPPPAPDREGGGTRGAARPPGRDPAGEPAPAVSVVVPTRGRPDAVRTLVAALADQRDAPDHELVLVDDGGDLAPPAAPFPLRMLRTPGVGPAAARNAGLEAARGALVVLLDDDLVPAPGWLAAHARAHADATARMVVGACPPGPSRASWTEDIATWWWWDQLRHRRLAAAPVFTDMLSGNLSAPRALLLDLGGLRADFGRRRREDWELGLRAMRAGVEVRLAEEAEAEHRFRLTTADHVRSAAAEGAGDALLLAAHPESLAALPLGGGYGWWGARHPVRALLGLMLRTQTGRRVAVAALALLERARARRTWARLLGVTHAAAYRAGLAGEGLARRPRARPAPAVLRLGHEGPLPAPGPVIGDVRVIGVDGTVREVRSPELRWDRELAERAVAAVPARALPGGPARPPTEPAAAAVPPVLRWSRSGGWAAIDAELRASRDDVVAILLPGSAPPDAMWLARAAAVAGLERVALAHGGYVQPDTPCRLLLYGRSQAAAGAAPPGAPASAVVVDRRRVLALGGFAATRVRRPAHAALHALVGRALDAGLVCASLDRPGVVAWRSALSPPAAEGALAMDEGRFGRIVAATALDVGAALRPRAHGRRRRAAAAVARAAGAMATRPGGSR